MRGMDVIAGIEFSKLGHRITHKIEKRLPPVIVILNGYVFGGGLEFACACDIRIATPDAIFAQPEIDIGVIPGWGGTQRLCRVIGLGRAKEMIYTGKHINAEEAHEIGLVNLIVPRAELDEVVESLTKALASKSRVALMSAKRAIQMNLETSLNVGLSYEIEEWGTLFGTYDQKEGMSAFMEKRKPQFLDK